MNNQKNKTLQKQQANTIDEKHNELLEHFNEIETLRIPKLENEIAELKSSIKILNDNEIEKYLDIRDKIISLRTELKSLKNEKKKYLLDNSKYIFQYFEQKQQISSGTITTQNSNVLNSFFKIKSTNHEASNVQSDKYLQSKKAFQNYWRNVSNEMANIQNFIITSDVCEICNAGEMIPQDEEGILICNNPGCGKFITYIVDSSKPTNKEPPNEVSYTAYIRLNHFKEILSQFQAKETTQIPEEVINAIKARIKKERIEDMSLINYDKMRDILRKLGFNKYFEHIQYINSLFGIKPPIMNEELHETLCVLFIEIQKPWAVHCPANRTNFFNYTYTLYQLCVLLDQIQYLPYIPMMKDREKQLEQDMIWKKVCNDLDWEYFPSV
jgi:Poxvirus Late Transcription Factor VLTF3 like